jgi:hypothetical protein
MKLQKIRRKYYEKKMNFRKWGRSSGQGEWRDKRGGGREGKENKRGEGEEGRGERNLERGE